MRELILDDRVQQLINTMPDAVLVADEEGRILSANTECERLTGYALEDLLGTEVEVLVPGSLHSTHRGHRHEYNSAPVGRVMGTGQILRLQRRDGRAVPVDISLAPTQTDTGLVVVAAIRDVTERERLHEQLRLSEERYRQLVEHASEIFYRIEFDTDPMRGRIAYVSPQCETITGNTPEAFLRDASLWVDSIHPDDLPSLAESTMTLVSNGGELTRYYRIRNHAGAYRSIADRIVALHDAEGRVCGYQGVARDITEQTNADEDRRRLQGQLQQSQKIEAIGRLAGGVAHDFNNLLTVILGYTELMKASAEAQNRSDLDEVERAAVRAQALTTQLLAFGRRQMLIPRMLNANDVVKGVVTMIERLLTEDIELTTQLDKDLGTIAIDPGQLEQVLVNLAINARDAMPEGGVLSISTRNIHLDTSEREQLLPPGDYSLLSVGDSGQGMDADTMAHIFEPFFTTKGERGTGLGLATVYGIVKQSGGFIFVDSEPSRGSAFHLYFPCVSGDSITAAKAAVVTPSTAGPGRSRARTTILLVEDSEAVRGLARRFLEEAGHIVLESATPEGALEIARRGTCVDILLTDVVLPGGSGPALYRKLQQLVPDLKVLYISGYTDDVVIRRGASDGTAPFLAKPFNRANLIAKLDEVMEMK
jgi:two-component system, cell cycle sensor histidine kinase and response regulator CckA